MSSATVTLAQFAPALPEILLAAGALALVLIGAFRGEKSFGLINTLALLLLALVGVLIATQDAATVSAFNGAFISDSFGRFMKIAVLIGSAVTLMISGDYLKATGSQQFEFPILVALSTLGMLLMISAGDLIALYLGLELSSLALYVVASFNRDSVKSTEAGLKYFVLGALSSGMLLYGASRDCERIERWNFAWRDFRIGVHSRRSCLQDFSCSVPYVDAGRV